jgi:hypothetical protein
MSGEGDSPVEQKQQTEEEEFDGDYEVPDEMEEVIEELLTGLRSSETIIRWSAAKGTFLLSSFFEKIVVYNNIAYHVDFINFTKNLPNFFNM